MLLSTDRRKLGVSVEWLKAAWREPEASDEYSVDECYCAPSSVEPQLWARHSFPKLYPKLIEYRGPQLLPNGVKPITY